MIITEKHIEGAENDHTQSILKNERDTLTAMIEDTEAKKDEILAILKRLQVIRDAIISRIEPDQLELDFDAN